MSAGSEVDEQAAFEQAITQAWRMIDPLHPPGSPGSYARGEHNGIIAALKTVHENFTRIRASRADRASAAPTEDALLSKVWAYGLAASNGFDAKPEEAELLAAIEAHAVARERQARAAPTEGVEPVAEVVSAFGDPEAFGERTIEVLCDLRKIPYNTKLYAAPTRPAAPDAVEALREMPPLPEPWDVICMVDARTGEPLEEKIYTEGQMREYARSVLQQIDGKKG